MPKSTVIEHSDYPLPQDTWLPAMLTKVEPREIPYDVKKNGVATGERSSFTVWEWTFHITDGDYSGTDAKGDTESKVTNASEPSGKSALVRPWAEALLGRELQIGEELDTDDLLGLGCYVRVRHDEPREKRNGGYFFPCPVVDLHPVAAADPTVDKPPF